MSKKQPCGHPVECIVSGDEGTNYCGWCHDVTRLREAIQNALFDISGVKLAVRILKAALGDDAHD